MYEIKEKRRMLPDGTEITTYTRDVVRTTMNNNIKSWRGKRSIQSARQINEF